MLIRAKPPEGEEIRKIFGNSGSDESFPRIKYFKVVEAHSEVSTELLYTLIKKIEDNELNECFLPNLPTEDNNHFDGWFERTPLLDEPRNWLQLDIDWQDDDYSTVNQNLEDAVDFAVSQIPFLDSLSGLVAQFSNKAGIPLYSERLSLRLYIVLSEAMTSQELRSVFLPYCGKGIGTIDRGMLESNRIHLVSPPCLFNTERFLPQETVKLFEGEPLDVSKLRKATPPISEEELNARTEAMNIRYDASIEEWQREINKKAAQGFFDGNRWEGIMPIIFRWMMLHPYDRRILNCLNTPLVLSEEKNDSFLDYVWQWCEDKIRTIFLNNQFMNFDNVQTVNEKDLADAIFTIPDSGHLLVASGCGSNKSNAVVERVIKEKKPKRLLYIGARKAYIEPMCITHDIAYYEPDLPNNRIYMLNQDCLGSCSRSVHKLFEDGLFQPYDLVIVDECELTAIDAASDKQCWQDDVVSKLVRLCSEAKLGIYLDASATNDISGWFVNEIARISEKKSHLIRNTADYMEGMWVFQIPTETEAIATIEEAINDGKRVHIHTGFSDQTSKKRMSKIQRYLESATGKKVVHFDAESIKDAPELKANPNKALKALLDDDDVRAFMTSPWWGVGSSYMPDEGPHFDVSVGIYPTKLHQADEIVQSMRRCRLTTEHFIYLDKSVEFIEKDWLSQLIEIVYPHKKRGRVDFGTNDKLRERVEERRNRCFSNLSLHLKLLCLERGANFDISPLEYEEADLEKIRVECKIQSEKAWLDEVRKTISDPLTRRKTARAFGLDDLPQDIELASQLHKRYLDIDREKIRSFLDIWGMTPEEREEADIGNKQIAAWFIGSILDAISAALRPHLSDSVSFFDWYFDEKQREFHYPQHSLNIDEMKELYESKQKFAREYFRGFPKEQEFLESPQTGVNAVLRNLDLEVKTKPRLGRVDAKKAVFKQYKRELRGRKLKDAAKVAFVMAKIAEKKAKGWRLTEAEKTLVYTSDQQTFVSKPEHQFEELKDKPVISRLREIREYVPPAQIEDKILSSFELF